MPVGQMLLYIGVYVMGCRASSVKGVRGEMRGNVYTTEIEISSFPREPVRCGMRIHFSRVCGATSVEECARVDESIGALFFAPASDAATTLDRCASYLYTWAFYLLWWRSYVEIYTYW